MFQSLPSLHNKLLGSVNTGKTVFWALTEPTLIFDQFLWGQPLWLLLSGQTSCPTIEHLVGTGFLTCAYNNHK